jgi:hypothetical protein
MADSAMVCRTSYRRSHSVDRQLGLPRGDTPGAAHSTNCPGPVVEVIGRDLSPLAHTGGFLLYRLTDAYRMCAEDLRRMRVLIANNTGREARRMAERFPDFVGHLYSPGGWRSPSRRFPYAVDNGAYRCFAAGRSFDDASYLQLLRRLRGTTLAPMWVAVPDVVADRPATIALWAKWVEEVGTLGHPLAFVVQDGMTPADVPAEASIVFVGGSTAWKWATIELWADSFDRVHVGRVNSPRRLRECARLGVESVDGTGWFRGDRVQLDGLWYFLADRCRIDDPVLGPMQRRFSLAGGAGSCPYLS